MIIIKELDGITEGLALEEEELLRRRRMQYDYIFIPSPQQIDFIDIEEEKIIFAD